jgi:hypothetical protein
MIATTATATMATPTANTNAQAVMWGTLLLPRSTGLSAQSCRSARSVTDREAQRKSPAGAGLVVVQTGRTAGAVAPM